MGIVAGSVNKPNQTAAEVVQEIVEQATSVLSGANDYLVVKTKL